MTGISLRGDRSFDKAACAIVICSDCAGRIGDSAV